jgi:hypothetical protein
MDRMPGEDDEPLESKLLSNVIESAQSKVEGRNFSIRKSVLEYDDVMNRQREIIYSQRDQVLDGENLRDTIIKMVSESMESMVNEYLPHDDKDHWNLEGLRDALKGWVIDEDDEETLVYDEGELDKVEKEYIMNELSEKANQAVEVFHDSLTSYSKRPWDMLVQLIIGGLQLIALMSVIYCIYRGLGLVEESYIHLVALHVMEFISAAYAPLPGASGASEGVFSMYFGKIFPDGYSFAALLLWRFFTYYISLIMGVVVVMIQGVREGKTFKEVTREGDQVLEASSKKES